MTDPRNGLGPEDMEILKRLNKLREDDNKNAPIATDEDIRNRLAALRGVPASTLQSTSKTVFKPDTRSDQQKSDDLLKQFAEECNLESQAAERQRLVDEQIKKRLGELKDNKNASLPNNPSNVDSLALVTPSADEPEILQVIRQAMLSPSDDEDLSDVENDSEPTSDDESSNDERSDDD